MRGRDHSGQVAREGFWEGGGPLCPEENHLWSDVILLFFFSFPFAVQLHLFLSVSKAWAEQE